MNRLSLKLTIFAGVLLIASLQMASEFVSRWGQQKMSDQLHAIRLVEGSHADGLKIEFDVQEMRLRVDRFVTSGHDSLIAEVQNIHQRVKRRLVEARNKTNDDEIVKVFDAIAEHSQAYVGQFKEVVKERQLREQLVRVELPNLSASVETRFSEVELEYGDSKLDAQNQLLISQAKSNYIQAQKALLQYFERPDSQHFDLALIHFGQSLNLVAQSSVPDTQKNELLQDLKRLSQLGLRAVQATRGYLYLRNVVMAGEQSEVSFYARQLRELTDHKRVAIVQRAEGTRIQVANTNQRVAGVALIFSLGVAVWLFYSIVPPVTKLTDTFEALSAGRTVEIIPGADRPDEIGQMAQAAKVFSDQNRKTRELLDETEAMAQVLELQTENLERINEELDNFAYVASHDLKSPLRGIRQLASWIEEDSAHLLPEASIVHLQKLQSRIIKMENLLHELLEFSRVGRIEARPEVVNLTSMMRTIVEMSDNPHSIAIGYSSDLPLVLTRALPLKQVLINLISNAIKYNDKGRAGHVQIAISIPSAGIIHVAVSDNGCGIEAENHDRIFQMYQRVCRADIEGSGMGLAIVRKHLQHVGQEVVLTSEPGRGTTFEFDWPAELVEAAIGQGEHAYG